MKKIISLVLAIFMLFSLSACGNKNDDIDASEVIDATAEEIAEAILSKVSFSVELTELDADVAATLFSIEDDTKVIAYYSTSELAEEIVIIESVKSDVKSTLEAYRDKQLGIFEKYSEKEAEKIKNAYFEVLGKCTVYCVSKSADDVKTAISSLTK